MNCSQTTAQLISDGKAILGIELGSTRIKAVLTDNESNTIASGSFTWENQLVDNIWTYSLEDVKNGIQQCYAQLCCDVREKYNVKITKLGAIGFSAMMHGYLVFDRNGNQLAQFRTWRNTITQQAAEKLTKLFNFNIPQRWSIAHLYQAVLNNESHVRDIAFQTTLAGYVHYMLTGEKIVGTGEASGIFPVDENTCDYNEEMIAKFDEILLQNKLSFKLRDILPSVKNAGENAGCLTTEGALYLDPTGTLQSGTPLCPPEGDAGTGMVATNSTRVRTGNISAGTSVFAMAVLDKPLKNVYTEIDMVATPTGKPVAMVHCNNCSSDIDAWVNIFREFTKTAGFEISTDKLYNTLFNCALSAKPDCGGVYTCNYFSGEPVTAVDGGRPLVARTPDAEFSLSNFMRANLYGALSTLKIGMDILQKNENVTLEKLTGHGGFFKSGNVGQKICAAALDTPVCVMTTASEGGAWGIAILAAYCINKNSDETLEDYLENRIFSKCTSETCNPDSSDVKGFEKYISDFKNVLNVEKCAVENID